MTFDHLSCIKSYLSGIGYKQHEMESMMNNLHEGEWWSHNWQSDEFYEDIF